MALSRAQTDSDKEALKLSVQSLQRLYAFVIALAIGNALTRFLVDPSTQVPVITRIGTARGALFACFLATVVPFFHGMNRHLDDIYALNRIPRVPQGDTPIPRPGAILLDLSVFIAEAGLLYLLSWAVLDEQSFFLLIATLLLIDALWAFLTHLISGSSAGIWGIINIVASPLIFVCRGLHQLSPESRLTLLTSIVILRTGLDYWSNWPFYFPGTREKMPS